MDKSQLELTQQHYDLHVKANVSTEQALAERRLGAAAALKDFHNHIKKAMIHHFAGGAESLLDLACGRGGDLHKWQGAGIKYIKGLDLAGREVEEAKKRYRELREREGRRGRPVAQMDFEQTNQLGQTEWRERRTFAAVSCMFAAHYFFERRATLRAFLHNVAVNLREGGYFFGTLTSGKRVQAMIAENGEGGTFESPDKLLRLRAKWAGQPACFGSPYFCSIGETVAEGHGGVSEGSLEFLVYFSTLKAVAAEHGLVPVQGWASATPDLSGCFVQEEVQAGAPFLHFAPRFPTSTPVGIEMASSLFAAFAFQKRTQPERPAQGASPVPPADRQQPAPAGTSPWGGHSAAAPASAAAEPPGYREPPPQPPLQPPGPAPVDAHSAPSTAASAAASEPAPPGMEEAGPAAAEAGSGADAGAKRKREESPPPGPPPGDPAGAGVEEGGGPEPGEEREPKRPRAGSPGAAAAVAQEPESGELQ